MREDENMNIAIADNDREDASFGRHRLCAVPYGMR